MNEHFDNIHLDVFRIITGNLSLYEYLSLSHTCKAVRVKCIQDLQPRLGKQTILTFGFKLLKLATCQQCNLISWAVYNGCCPHPWSCIDCNRRGVPSQFILVNLVVQTSSVKSTIWQNWHPICRYGCNFMCNICDKIFLHGQDVTKLKGHIICNVCWIHFFAKALLPKIEPLYPEFQCKRVSKWNLVPGWYLYSKLIGDENLWHVPSSEHTGDLYLSSYFVDPFESIVVMRHDNLGNDWNHFTNPNHYSTCMSDSDLYSDSDSDNHRQEISNNLEWNQVILLFSDNSVITIGKWKCKQGRLDRNVDYHDHYYHDYLDDDQDDHYSQFDIVEPYYDYYDLHAPKRGKLGTKRYSKNRAGPRKKGIKGVEHDSEYDLTTICAPARQFVEFIHQYKQKMMTYEKERVRMERNGFNPVGIPTTPILTPPFLSSQYPEPTCSYTKHSRDRIPACKLCIFENDPKHLIWRVRKLPSKCSHERARLIQDIIGKTRILYLKLKEKQALKLKFQKRL